MVRISKQAERRQVSPRKRKAPQAKTGSLKGSSTSAYKEHPNALNGEAALKAFIPKIY